MDIRKLITKAKEDLGKIKEGCSKVLGARNWRSGIGGLISKFRLLFSRIVNKQQPQSPAPDPQSPLPFGSWLRKIGKTVSDFLLSLETRYLHRFPEKQRRPMLFGIWGAAMLVLVLLISIPVTLSGRTRQAAPVRVISGLIIPANELFIPSEPDFLPEFLFEREPRSYWLLEDLRPYWRVPEDTELWRDQIKSVVDRLMESVP